MAVYLKNKIVVHRHFHMYFVGQPIKQRSKREWESR